MLEWSVTSSLSFWEKIFEFLSKLLKFLQKNCDFSCSKFSCQHYFSICLEKCLEKYHSTHNILVPCHNISPKILLKYPREEK